MNIVTQKVEVHGLKSHDIYVPVQSGTGVFTSTEHLSISGVVDQHDVIEVRKPPSRSLINDSAPEDLKLAAGSTLALPC
jgi:hypothetical protein